MSKKVKSVNNLLDKAVGGRKNTNGVKSVVSPNERFGNIDYIGAINPMLAQKMRSKSKQKNNLRKPNKAGLSLSEVDKVLMTKAKFGREAALHKSLDVSTEKPMSQIKAVRKARSNFRKSRRVFKTQLKASVKNNPSHKFT